jgi:hypothetical protein
MFPDRLLSVGLQSFSTGAQAKTCCRQHAYGGQGGACQGNARRGLLANNADLPI